MRSTVVPAQVTTVEDRITGSLSLSQLLLLILPIFLGSALFVSLPPFFNYAVYKIVLIVCLVALCSVLAVRFKGRILLLWAVVILQYNLRARYYVTNKNDAFLRDYTVREQFEEEIAPAATEAAPSSNYGLSTLDVISAQSIIDNPQANFHFKTNRKGELYVSVTEIK